MQKTYRRGLPEGSRAFARGTNFYPLYNNWRFGDIGLRLQQSLDHVLTLNSRR